jgi:hypothetical protein
MEKHKMTTKYDLLQNLWVQLTLIGSTFLTFIVSYFTDLTSTNGEQFLAVAAVVLLDGVFGIIRAIRVEGFETRKALKIPKSLATWWVILSVILTVESGIDGTYWLSETILIPFLIFYLISALKNASLAKLIDSDLVNIIMDSIDKHKGIRIPKNENKPEN